MGCAESYTKSSEAEDKVETTEVPKQDKREEYQQESSQLVKDQETETNANAEKATVVELSKVDENSKQSEQLFCSSGCNLFHM